MTPVAGLLMAIIAGLVVRGPRRATAAVISPWLAVLVVQTWTLGSGRGSNPASTISDAAYWMVQAVALGLAMGVAAALSDWRTRSTARSSLVAGDRPAPTQARWRATLWTAVTTGAAGALALAYVLLSTRSRRLPNRRGMASRRGTGWLRQSRASSSSSSSAVPPLAPASVRGVSGWTPSLPRVLEPVSDTSRCDGLQ